MDFDMDLWGYFDVCKDIEGNIVIKGQETNGNTFTIRSRRRKEITNLIKELEQATADNSDFKFPDGQNQTMRKITRTKTSS